MHTNESSQKIDANAYTKLPKNPTMKDFNAKWGIRIECSEYEELENDISALLAAQKEKSFNQGKQFIRDSFTNKWIEDALAAQRMEAAEEIRGYREDLRFIWRWISRLNGDKSHDRPEQDWKTYVACLVNYPGSPYDTKDWYEDDKTSPILSSLSDKTEPTK